MRCIACRSPRTPCGACCFVPCVDCAEPHFRIRRADDDTLSVRLTAKICGCDDPIEAPASVLNDVWRVTADGRLIRSMKTRGHYRCCGVWCVSGAGTGQALFVAADDLPAESQIITALQAWPSPPTNMTAQRN
jgi:hypothetical protein